VNAYLAGHRKLGLSTLGNEIYASLYVLYAKDRLFKKGGELGLGSDWDAKSDHEYFSAFFRVHTSPPKVYMYPLIIAITELNEFVCLRRFWQVELMHWIKLSKNDDVGG
jgi:hypothetical protein